MSDPIIIAHLVSAGPFQQYAGDNASTGETLSMRTSLEQGQTLEGRVLGVSQDGTVVLEIGGEKIEVTGLSNVQVGQALIIRIEAVQPQLLFEVLSLPQGQSLDPDLMASIKTLFSTNTGIQSELNALLDSLGKIAGTVPDSVRTELVQALQQALESIAVKPDSSEVEQNIRTLIRTLGLTLESDLRAAVEAGGTGKVPEAATTLKALIAQVIANLETTAKEPLKPLPTVVEGHVKTILATITNRWVGSLPGAVDARLGKIIADIRQAVVNLSREAPSESFSKTTIEQLATAREQLTQLSASMPKENAEAFARTVERALADLNQVFSRTEEGSAVLARLNVLEALKGAHTVQERIEAMQVFNSVSTERDGSLLLQLPVSILNEMTQVEIKQFLSGGQKAGEKKLTVVMLLNLETLGRVRIDTMLVQNTLYCGIAVENETVSRLVDSLKVDFARQLEARGYRLGSLKCTIDSKKINQFHQMSQTVIGSNETLIDVQI